jgi:beta-lactamase class A
MYRLAATFRLGAACLPQPVACGARLMKFLLTTACICTLLLSQEASTTLLDSHIKARISGFQGHVSLYAKNLASGASYSLAGDDPVRTASTIKFPIMIECFAEAAEGKLDLAAALKLTEDEKVSGSGILQDLSAGRDYPLSDLIVLMITLSDNTATNLIIDRISGNAVNARMAKLGLEQTRCMRKISGDGKLLKPFVSGVSEEGAKAENKRWGIGRSTPHEMVILLEKLYRGELVDKSASAQMLEILKKQRDHSSIGRDLNDVVIANKSGALDALRSDVGIVFSKQGPIAMAITVDGMPTPNWSPDNPGELLIASLSEILVDSLH